MFVQRLADAGAVLLGKTRAPEFNWKGITDSPAFGITRNPWNPSLTPGGSSGGCAAAVAAGVVRLSMGSDAGGSIRIPAAFTGTIGLKPTHGRIPLSPLPSAFANIVHTGPIAAGMDELQEAYLATRGASPLDWTSNLGEDGGADAPAARPASACCRPGAGAHAAPRRCAPRWTRRWRAARRRLRRDRSRLRHRGRLAGRPGPVPAGLRGRRARHRARAAWPARPRAAGLRAGVDDWPISRYHAICQQRDRYANELAALHARVDLLLLPTVPLCAFEAGRDVPQDQPGADWMS